MTSEPQLAQFHAPLRPYLQRVVNAMNQVSAERRVVLAQAADFIRVQHASGVSARLTFICTHNSRRSHLAHVWAQVAASYFDLASMQAFSGGTEVTACNERTVATLRRAGLEILRSEDPAEQNVDNPRYHMRYHAIDAAVVCFSKVYNQAGNPTVDYAAMMCCSDVDARCPVVEGASLRVALHYRDPKEADDTDAEASRYDERCLEIAVEMFVMASLV